MITTYQAFRGANMEHSMYDNLYNLSTDGLKDIYDVAMQVGIYSAGIALLLVAIAFLVVKTSNPQEYADAKWRLIKTAIIVALLFSIVSAIAFVQALGKG